MSPRSTRFLRGAALWDHVFPFSRQTGLGVEGSDGKTAKPHSSYHRTSGFDLARARPLGLAAMRGEGREGKGREGQEAPTRRAVVKS
jgi:hypothetical protein